MSTTGRKTRPPLEQGQRLDQETFHDRYEAMPAGTRAELIGGVVFMPSPVSREHSETESDLSYWLNHYRFHTPGVRAGQNASVFLDEDSEVQPDLMLMVREECGGQVRPQGDYDSGAPELVIEVGKSSRGVDLGEKKAEYERAGVREYLFVGIEPDEVRWFVRREGRFEEFASDEAGVFRSEVFPGLWLDGQALSSGDLSRPIAVLQEGLASPEHEAFVDRLRQARERAS